MIPTLVQANGDFCSSKEIRKRTEDTIDIEECQLEIEAQLQRFIEITGKKPDYLEGHAVFSNNFFIALKNTAKKHDLFYVMPGLDKEWEEENKIYGFGFPKFDERGLYDPKLYMEENYKKYKDKECGVAIFHPGYLDQYILNVSSYTIIRPMETEYLCNQDTKEWIQKNNIELVDFRQYKK